MTITPLTGLQSRCIGSSLVLMCTAHSMSLQRVCHPQTSGKQETGTALEKPQEETGSLTPGAFRRVSCAKQHASVLLKGRLLMWCKLLTFL